MIDLEQLPFKLYHIQDAFDKMIKSKPTIAKLYIQRKNLDIMKAALSTEQLARFNRGERISYKKREIIFI